VSVSLLTYMSLLYSKRCIKGKKEKDNEGRNIKDVSCGSGVLQGDDHSNGEMKFVPGWVSLRTERSVGPSDCDSDRNSGSNCPL
jgi:hypothetical protein